MKNINIIYTVVSWEERFVKGLEIDVKTSTANRVVFFQFAGYETRNQNNFEKAIQICHDSNVKFEVHTLDFIDPKGNWRTISNAIKGNSSNDKILLDITTMPRETIWTILFFLEQAKSQIDYVYYRPEKHNAEWLSRDPSDPRLLYKMSGISELGKPTLLFVFTGHDYQRVSNLISYFEPQKLVIASQGDVKGTEVVRKCIREFEGNILIDQFEFDSYDATSGYIIISKKVEEYFRDFNIVFSSLGPKTSAIPIYKINRAYPEIALCYIPCKEFNMNYSEGFLENDFVYGTVQIPQRKYKLIEEY